MNIYNTNYYRQYQKMKLLRLILKPRKNIKDYLNKATILKYSKINIDQVKNLFLFNFNLN